jgi:hypothetical protein
MTYANKTHWLSRLAVVCEQEQYADIPFSLAGLDQCLLRLEQQTTVPEIAYLFQVHVDTIKNHLHALHHYKPCGDHGGCRNVKHTVWYRGGKYTLPELLEFPEAVRYHLSYHTLYKRIVILHWSVKQAVETPKQSQGETDEEYI